MTQTPSMLREDYSDSHGPFSRPKVGWVPRLAPPDLLVLVLLLGLALLPMSREIVFGGTVHDGDIILQSMPVYSWYADALRQGRIPIWSPSILGGFPLAFGQYSFFYPPDILLFRVLDAARAFHLSLSLHLALAGACTYWYCRVLGMRRLPSVFAAVVFQMGNEVLAWPANGFITRTLFVLPALLASVELTVGRSRPYWLLIPPVIGAGLLGGYAQIVLFALAVAGIYALVLVASSWGLLGLKGSAHLISLLALGVAAGFGLAAVRVVPTMAITALSTRAEGLGLAQSFSGSIEPWALIAGYLLPAVFDVPGWFTARPDYIGFPALLLAALALLSKQPRGRSMALHAGLAGVGTILSLGSSTPLYGVLAQLPLFSYFRGPNRFSLLVAFSLAILAAQGLDRCLSLDLGKRRALRWGVGVLAVVAIGGAAIGLAASLAFQWGRDPISEALREAAVGGGWDLLNLLRPRVGLPLLGIVLTPLLILMVGQGRLSHRVLEWSMLGLTTVTLGTLGWTQNSWLPSEKSNELPALVEQLRQDPEHYRVFSWAPRVSTYNVGGYYRGVVGYPPSREFEEEYLHQFMPPNLGMLFGVSTIDGYEALQSRRQALLAIYMGSDRTDPARFEDGSKIDSAVHGWGLTDRLELLAALNVKYLMHAFPMQDPRLEWMGEVALRIYPDLGAEARVHLYRLKDSLPRAFLVPGSEVMSGEREVLEALSRGTADLRQVVILEEATPALPMPALTQESSAVDIIDYSDERVVLKARTDGSGYLTLLDSPMLGWSATVNGRPVPILAANFAGRAVALDEPGEHLIEFRYQAPLLLEGAVVSAATMILLLSIPLSLLARSHRPAG